MKAPSIPLALIAVLVLGIGINGFVNAANDLPNAPNALATIVAVLNLLMGVAGIGAAVFVWQQKAQAVPFLWVWGGSAVAASVLAPRAYAPEVGWPPVLIGGIVTAAIVVAIVVFVRQKLGREPGASATSS